MGVVVTDANRELYVGRFAVVCGLSTEAASVALRDMTSEQISEAMERIRSGKAVVRDMKIVDC